MNRICCDLIKDSIRSEVFSFCVGDTIKVSIRISEGGKERIQIFEGVVIFKRGNGISQNFAVRKVSHGVAVERIFPINCPNVKSIELVSRGKVRRAKLYYLRKRFGKNARIKQV